MRVLVIGTRREYQPRKFSGSKAGQNQLPSDLIASRLREAVLLFDNKEAKNLGNQERKEFSHG
jgi:hypothetical protein